MTAAWDNVGAWLCIRLVRCSTGYSAGVNLFKSTVERPSVINVDNWSCYSDIVSTTQLHRISTLTEIVSSICVSFEIG